MIQNHQQNAVQNGPTANTGRKQFSVQYCNNNNNNSN